MMPPSKKQQLKHPRADFSNLISKPPRRAATSSTPLRNAFYSPNSHDKYKHIIMFKNGIKNNKTEERRSQSMGFLTESAKERVKYINFGSSSTTQESITTKVEKYYQLCASKIDEIYNRKHKQQHQSPPGLSQTHYISSNSRANMKAKGASRRQNNHEQLRRINSMDISCWLNKIEVVQVLDKDYKVPFHRASSKDYHRKERTDVFKICNQSPIKRKRSMFNKRSDGLQEEFVLDAWQSAKNTIENPF